MPGAMASFAPIQLFKELFFRSLGSIQLGHSFRVIVTPFVRLRQQKMVALDVPVLQKMAPFTCRRRSAE
jgi:hypothetical protein